MKTNMSQLKVSRNSSEQFPALALYFNGSVLVLIPYSNNDISGHLIIELW